MRTERGSPDVEEGGGGREHDHDHRSLCYPSLFGDGEGGAGGDLGSCDVGGTPRRFAVDFRPFMSVPIMRTAHPRLRQVRCTCVLVCVSVSVSVSVCVCVCVCPGVVALGGGLYRIYHRYVIPPHHLGRTPLHLCIVASTVATLIHSLTCATLSLHRPLNPQP